MNDLELFKVVNGKSLEVGMTVVVDRSNKYKSDWPGEYVVLGINFKRSDRKEIPGKVDVTIGDDWADGGSDGWSPLDLRPTS